MPLTPEEKALEMDLKPTTPCSCCGCEYAEHNYVPDSITTYVCPHPHVESTYGAFHGGDPRDFHPDGECCTEEERENHRKACELWNECEASGKTPDPEECPSGWIYDDTGKAIAHVLRSPYGIGVSTIEFEQYFEPQEQDE